ncbi:MAG: ATP synthase F1 subunit epsilon [Planctomycetaceae bacterium]|nr:ATP synthase F1 subunit epsilon [Planctomycetaceae bacterium]
MAETTTTVGANQVRCTVVTPEETVVDSAAEFVALPLFDGELGVARNHAPMIGRLGFGELRLRTGNDVTRFYVNGGFVQVSDNEVSVLTNRATPAAKLDATALAEQAAKTLASRAAGEEELELRERQVNQLNAQLRLARKG